MPTRKSTHIDKPMTNVSTAYMQSAENYIADMVFPQIPVQKQSDVYFEYSRADFFRDEAQERANGTESAGSDYGVQASDPYYCKVYAFHKDVTEQDRANMDNPLDANKDATHFVSEKMLIKRERVWSDTYFKAGVWATDIAGVSGTPGASEVKKWSDPTSTPIEDVEAGLIHMAETTGYRPNMLVLSAKAFSALKNHPDILDRIKYTQKGIVTEDLLAGLFGVKHIKVSWAVINTAKRGAAENTGFLNGAHALLLYVTPTPGLRVPSAGYIFAWTGLLGAGAYANRIRRFPMEHLGEGTERVEGEIAFAPKVVGQDLGYMFTDVV